MTTREDDATGPGRSVPGPGAAPEPRLVVGIGASAGGLTALKRLLGSMPADAGMVFVVVVHLAPERESHMAELLQPHCPMPVQQVSGNVALAPNHVYIIPPGANLDTIDTHLRLSDLEPLRRERAPIDHFFRTLAHAHGGRAVGMVLTGTGSDGTLGLRQIQEQGGVTIAQEPTEAEFDGMPRSAILAGVVDLVLSLDTMPARLAELAHTDPRIPLTEADEAPDDAERLLQKVLAHVRAVSGREFGQYKRSTVMRRIRRRMQLHHIEELGSYLDVVRKSRDEARRLSDDLLITVTEFFRDEDAFTRLERDIIPRLFEGKGPEDHLRVWSVGCSTGEEAYSLAILMLEEAARRELGPSLQVFASDLQDHALKRAREGVYPESIRADVSAERLARFFTREDSTYRVHPSVREAVVFAPHNLLRDPPFAHVDLITCRNLLIYLQRDAQRDAIGIFHYALNPDGYLMLGSSETVDRSDLFIEESKEHGLYRRRNLRTRELHVPLLPRGFERRGEQAAEPQTQRDLGFGALHQTMVERYAPPSVLVNQDQEVVHYSVRAGRYLKIPGGEPTNRLIKLVQEPLRIELQATFRACRQSGVAAVSRPIPLTIEGATRHVVIRVHPAEEAALKGFFLVIFEDVELQPEQEAPAQLADATVAELEAELELTRQRLRTILDESESGREETQASFEELQSANEELRSTMEELETGKEELQSLNEELSTVNQENRHRVEELSQLTADLQNLMAATRIPTLFLDAELRILRFTPQIEELFNVRPTDRGRPFTDLTHHLGDNQIEADARSVLERLEPVERELATADGRWYLTRVLPYRSADHRIDGAVITFLDITARRRAEEELRESLLEQGRLVESLAAERGTLATVLESLPVGVWIVDREGRIEGRNQEADRIWGREGNTEASGSTGRFSAWHRPGGEPLAAEDYPHVKALRTGQPVQPVELRVRRGDGSDGVILASAAPIRDAQGQVTGAVGVNLDLTASRQAEQALQESEERFRVLVETSALTVWRSDASGRHVAGAASSAAAGGEWWPGEAGLEAVHPDDRERIRTAWAEALADGSPLDLEIRVRHVDGTWRWTNARAAPVRDASGAVRRWIGISVDISERKRVEEELLYARNAVAAAEHRERKRVAGVLHDELQQFLVAIKFQLKAALAQQPAAALRSLIEESASTIDQAIESSRNLTHQLQPPVLAQEGLVPALRWLGSEMARRHGIAVTIEAASEGVALPHVERTLLFECVRELLLNAVKHAGVDAATVVVRRRPGRLVLTVSDRGAGMPAWVTARGGQSGGGLGLFNVHERVRALGGTVDVTSSPGEGTSVEIDVPFPAEPAAERQPAPPVLRRREATAAPIDGDGPVRVLVADNHAGVRARIIELLAGDERMRVVGEARDGEQALTAVAEHAPAVVLMDISMPKLDGVEATRRIRERWPKVVVLGLSVMPDAETIAEMRAAGAAGVVCKTECGESLVASIIGAARPDAPNP